jgi:hypothetical protein
VLSEKKLNVEPSPVKLWAAPFLSDGKRGSRQGGAVRWRGIADITERSNHSHRFTAGPSPARPCPSQPADGTASQHSSLRARADARTPSRSLTGRTAWALFSIEPCPSCKCRMCLNECPASQRPFHTLRPMATQSPAVPVPSRAPTRHRAGLACAALASQQPLYTQSGLVDRSNRASWPSAICHRQSN